MNRLEEYRANAEKCDRMARTTLNREDRQKWEEMAASWRRMAGGIVAPGEVGTV